MSSGNRFEPTPKQPVMDQHQIGTALSSRVDRGQAGIHGSGDPIHDPPILQLETVQSVGLVGYLRRPKVSVEVGGEISKIDRHLLSRCTPSYEQDDSIETVSFD